MATISLPRNKELYAQLCEKYPQCAAVWKYFLSLNEVPRPSNHTAAATAWAIQVGKAMGAEVHSDSVGNVALRFPATPGKEKMPGVVLQAHLDMVGTKADEIQFDFTKDQLTMFVDKDLLRAQKTTLGADDGSGVAAVFALAEDKSVARGPLEILLTVDEEIGLVGAMKMKEGELLSQQAKYLINVDSEDFGEITVSCAGSVNRTLQVPVVRAKHEAGYVPISLKLKNFKGGHTGVHIHMGRANALKWAAYILQENKEAIAGTPFRIGALSGGNAHNAVPSSCVVEVSVPADRALQYVEECKALFASLKSRWDHVEGPAPTMEISLLAAPSTADALTFSSSRTALRFVESLHHGIWAWSEEVATLVETSQSVSKAGIEGNVFWVEVFARSSKNPALAALARLLDAYAAMYNGKCVQHMDDMPGWPAEPTSRLCVAAQEVYRREFKAEAKVVPIHAGLECGIILSKFPKNEMQAISIGPTVANPHTINEFMELESCVKLYHYIAKLVEDLAK